MGLFTSILLFLSGTIIGHFIPRIPILFFPRLKVFNRQFSPHPAPIAVDEYLLERLLLMRKLHLAGFVFALIPLLFGWQMIVWANSVLGFGLFMGVGWTLLDWLLPREWSRLNHATWPRALAEELQLIRNQTRDETERCCSAPSPIWEVTSVRCSNCYTQLWNRPRPDLGRKRCDGWILGTLRLWILDGQSFIKPTHKTLTSSEE